VRYIFYQYVNEPTRDSRILDLVLSTSSCFVSTTCTACPISTSDHNTVVFEVNAQDIATDKNLVPESVYYRDFDMLIIRILMNIYVQLTGIICFNFVLLLNSAGVLLCMLLILLLRSLFL